MSASNRHPMLRALPAFQDNYLWLLDAPEHGALVVDPGDAGPVLAEVAQGLRLAGIFVTHHHADHIGGLAVLRERLSLPCFGPSDERIPGPMRRVADGETVEVAGLRFEVLAVPGHTRSHIAYHGQGLVFCGDTLFSLGCGRMFEGTPAQMRASLDRLAALPGDTLVCCTHEYTLANAAYALSVDPDNPALRARAGQAKEQRAHGQPTLPSTIASERACNPFLRTGEPALLAAAAKRLGREPRDRDEVFAALRAGKDAFRG